MSLHSPKDNRLEGFIKKIGMMRIKNEKTAIIRFFFYGKLSTQNKMKKKKWKLTV